MGTLLDPAFVRELEALRRRLILRVPSGSTGEHGARRKGGSAEFVDHRAYEPGDDLRRVDWLAFARTGEPVVKQFRTEEDVILRLIIDTSGSLEGEKLNCAVRVAAALGYLGLASSERVQVFPFASGRMQSPSKPMRGRGGLGNFLRTLEGLEARGATDLSGAIDLALARGRPGLMAIVSDFMDPHRIETALTRARASGNDLVLVQVLSREEVSPTLTGDLLVEDAESGELIALTADVDTIEAYLSRLAGLQELLRKWARSYRATYVRLVADERVEDAVKRILDRRIDA